LTIRHAVLFTFIISHDIAF